MTPEQTALYEARLTAVANTRLLFNTMEELEEFLGNNSIHNNGIKRSYGTPQKLRSAYRDISYEVELMTDGSMTLGWVMSEYVKASQFCSDYFSRRKDPESIAMKLLCLHYKTFEGRKPNKNFMEIFRKMEDQKIEVGLVVLLLLKALPGYGSKSGDVTDIDSQFEKVLDFLDRFTDGMGLCEGTPAINGIRENSPRTRLMLIHHTLGILGIYENYSDDVSMTEANAMIRERGIDLDLDGIWMSEDGSGIWKIEQTINEGNYFMTCYQPEEGRMFTRVRYMANLFRTDDGKPTFYFLHPLAIQHRIKGLRYKDVDHAWYTAEYPDDARPDRLRLTRNMKSESWWKHLDLRRVTDEKRLEKLTYEIEMFPYQDAYEDCNYFFLPSIYAITLEAAYVLDEKEECFYKLPRETEHHFETLKLEDKVGILEMGGKRYLAIDERLLYIPLTPRALKKYSIEKVYEIS